MLPCVIVHKSLKITLNMIVLDPQYVRAPWEQNRNVNKEVVSMTLKEASTERKKSNNKIIIEEEKKKKKSELDKSKD